MSDAAQFEPRQLEQEVYRTPLAVQPTYEMWPTPENYRQTSLAGKALPATIRVWRVQNSGKTTGGVVSIGYGYGDSPDAEILAPGYNLGKQYGDVGIGRHASFLQWGFTTPPSQMTEAGRALFLNCICYIRKFDGKAPLVHAISRSREHAIRLALFIDLIQDKSFFTSVFPTAQIKEYGGRAETFAKYWQDNLELVYKADYYMRDEELKSVGISSNRTVAALGQMIALLKNSKTEETGRLLLNRYTEESFRTADEWQTWFDANKDRVYVSDVGGYKFRVIPNGYVMP